MGQRLQSRPLESDRTATCKQRFRRAICETRLLFLTPNIAIKISDWPVHLRPLYSRAVKEV